MRPLLSSRNSTLHSRLAHLASMEIPFIRSIHLTAANSGPRLHERYKNVGTVMVEEVPETRTNKCAALEI
jgi:hypothetical protein